MELTGLLMLEFKDRATDKSEARGSCWSSSAFLLYKLAKIMAARHQAAWRSWWFGTAGAYSDVELSRQTLETQPTLTWQTAPVNYTIINGSLTTLNIKRLFYGETLFGSQKTTERKIIISYIKTLWVTTAVPGLNCWVGT